VNFGYADDAHTGACADTSGNCHPDGPWLAGGAEFFLGGAFGTSTTGCAGTVAPCFDSGAIWIQANFVPRVPEPSTLFLIGVGLMGLAAWGRNRAQGTDRV
jgi:hypothetical protein